MENLITMKNFKNNIILFSSYFHALLFTYAAVSKLLDFENFQIQLAQSPLLSAFAGIISYIIISIELLLAVLLCIPKTRLFSLYGTLFLMSGFTVYIYLILNFSDFIPCSCGGILEELDWSEHLIFNLICVILAWIAIYLLEKSLSVNWKHTFIFTSLTIILASTTLYILYLNSEYIIKKENNFTRRFPHHPLIEEKTMDLGVNSYYFSGIHQNEVYLGNKTSPLTLISIDQDLKKMRKHSIKLENNNLIFKSLRIIIKSPYFYLYDGTVPIIYRGKIGQSTAKVISYQDAYFNQLKVIDSTTFIIRTESSKTKKQVLGILNLQKKTRLNLSENIISTNQKNIFEADGQLIADEKNLYYIFYYHNNILKADFHLQKTEHLKTIDTINKANIKTINLENGHQKMGAPPKIINSNSVVFNGILFNTSHLIGKFEDKKQWKKSTIIDIYNTNQRKYWGSWYLQNRGNNKMSQMLISKEHMFVLMGQEIVKYRIAQSLQEQFKTGEAENQSKE